MERVFCIAAGQLITKKKDHVIHRRNQYLNYGLLSLATILKQGGSEPIQIQGNFDHPLKTLKVAIDHGIESTTLPVLISVPSFYAISWVNEFLILLKEVAPSVRIILGGRWVIDNQIDHMKSLVPLADEIIPGTAERIIQHLVHKHSDAVRLEFLTDRATRHSLDYSLLYQRHLYQPSIEISRGCGMGCSFCQEKSEPLTQLKHPEQIVREAASTLIVDNLRPMNFYLEASMFVPNRPWIEQFASTVESCIESAFYWRTEARVDSLQPRHLETLYRCGLRVIDLGLESADHNQLIRMNKAKDPERYLRKASSLIQEAHRLGIMVKINVLLFAGETKRTVGNTLEWLERHSCFISGLSVGPVIVFGWPHRVSGYLDQLSSFGAVPRKHTVHGVTNLHLSSEMDYEHSMELAAEISKKFTTADNYFELKSFSYFSRDYTHEEFLRDCSKVDESLSFSLTPHDQTKKSKNRRAILVDN